MQSFRSEPTLRCYYNDDYEFKFYTESGDELEALPSDDTLTIPTWRARDPVDWSPNKSRYRGPRRKQEKKRVEVPSVWSLPPAS